MSPSLESVQTMKLPVSKVVPDPTQPRKTFSAVQDDELVQSFVINKQLVPIIVYRDGDQWIIVDGERRWRSATALEWETIEAKVLDAKPSDIEILVMQLTTNCQRSDLHPLDRLEAFKHLMRLTAWKATDLATNLALSKPTISRILSLDRFTDNEKSLLRNGVITTTEAYALARLGDQERAAKLCASNAIESESKHSSNPDKLEAMLTLTLQGSSIRLRGQACESFDAMLSTFKDLTRECKKAQRDGIDPKTFARILQDKSHSTSKEIADVSAIS